MNTKDFLRMGVPLGEATRRATDFVAQFVLRGGDTSQLQEEVEAILANPSAFVADPLRQDFAKALLRSSPPPRTEPVTYHQWGEGLEHEAVMQMTICLKTTPKELLATNTRWSMEERRTVTPAGMCSNGNGDRFALLPFRP